MCVYFLEYLRGSNVFLLTEISLVRFQWDLHSSQICEILDKTNSTAVLGNVRENAWNTITQ